MPYMFLRQDAHPKCWIPLHAVSVPIAKLNVGLLAPNIEEPVQVALSLSSEERSDFMERPFVVVSDAMRAALDGAGVDNVQYFKAQLQRERSQHVEHGYWLANILGKLSCVASSVPEFDPLDEDAHFSDVVQSVSLSEASTYGLSLFRLAQDWRMIVVSPRVQDALRAARLRGLLFQDPATYRGGSAVSHSELANLSRAASSPQ